jgi:hypothetical protein
MERISSDVLVSANFIPTFRSGIEVHLHLIGCIILMLLIIDGSTKPLTINMITFNTTFASLRKLI